MVMQIFPITLTFKEKSTDQQKKIVSKYLKRIKQIYYLTILVISDYRYSEHFICMKLINYLMVRATMVSSVRMRAVKLMATTWMNSSSKSRSAPNMMTAPWYMDTSVQMKKVL